MFNFFHWADLLMLVVLFCQVMLKRVTAPVCEVVMWHSLWAYLLLLVVLFPQVMLQGATAHLGDVVRCYCSCRWCCNVLQLLYVLLQWVKAHVWDVAIGMGWCSVLKLLHGMLQCVTAPVFDVTMCYSSCRWHCYVLQLLYVLVQGVTAPVGDVARCDSSCVWYFKMV